MCIVLDYVDPSSGNLSFKKSSAGGCRSTKLGDGCKSRQKESSEETPKKVPDLQEAPPHKKSPPLTLPTLSAKEVEKDRESEKRAEEGNFSGTSSS